MRYAIAFVCALWSFLGPCPEVRAAPAFGAAPKGDATVVASRIIKYNFPACKRVSGAVRQRDGSIRAKCDGIEYLVATLFDPKEGKVLELALNCKVAKEKLNISC
jgi:hypothetical protein